MKFEPIPNSGSASTDEKQFERLLRLVAALQASPPASALAEPAVEQPAEPVPPVTPKDASVRHEVEARAYQIYLERGGSHGWDMADWLQAEMEMQSKLGLEKILGRDKAIMRLALAWGLAKGSSESLNAPG